MPQFSSSSTNKARRGSLFGRRSSFINDQNEVYEKHLEQQVDEGNSALSKASSKAKKLRSCLTAVAEKVCDSEYGDMQLGGPNEIIKYSDTELRDFIIKNYYKQRESMTSTIAKLQKAYLQTKSERDSISKQLLQTEQRLKEAEARITDLEYELQHSVSVPSNDMTNLSSESDETALSDDEVDYSDIPDIALPPEPPEIDEPDMDEALTHDSNIVIMNGKPHDISQVRRTMDIQQNTVLKVMGEQGINEVSELVEYCLKLEEFSSEAKIRATINKMIKNEIISTQKHPVLSNGQLLSLSDLGKEIFMNTYKKKPCTDEIHRIVKMHDNIDHGYYIKYMAKALEESNYTNVCMDAEKNSIPIGAGKRYVPDIVAEFNGRKTFWEVERGNHHDADFFEKMDKAAVATGGTVYVIGDNAKTKEHLLKQVQAYAQKKRKEKSKVHFVIYVGTLNDFKTGRLLQERENRIPIGASGKA